MGEVTRRQGQSVEVASRGAGANDQPALGHSTKIISIHAVGQQDLRYGLRYPLEGVQTDQVRWRHFAALVETLGLSG